MKLKLTYGVFSVLLLMCSSVRSQQVDLQLERDSILIGQQINATITVQYEISDQDNQVVWPQLKTSLADGVEIISRSPIDTLAGIDDSNPLLFEQTLMLTVSAFDSGFYAIAPLQFIVDGLPIESNPALLSVYYPELDPSGAIMDIKEIRAIDFTWRDWLALYWYWLLGIICLVGGGVWLAIWLSRRNKVATHEIKEAPKVVIPAHVLALQQLDELEAKKLWQNEKVKLFYTEITTIFRQYLEGRYGIQALEETSDEIMIELRRKGISNDHLERIQSLLRLADLVKFAKEKPLPHDHERAMTATRDFIHYSKAEQVEENV